VQVGRESGPNVSRANLVQVGFGKLAVLLVLSLLDMAFKINLIRLGDRLAYKLEHDATVTLFVPVMVDSCRQSYRDISELRFERHIRSTNPRPVQMVLNAHPPQLISAVDVMVVEYNRQSLLRDGSLKMVVVHRLDKGVETIRFLSRD